VTTGVPQGLGAAPGRSSSPSTTRRLAAAGALLAVAAAVVLAVIGLLSDPLRLVATVVLIGIAVAVGWAALVHRGVIRVVAIVVAVLCIVGVVLLFGFGDPLRTVSVFVLVGLALAATRVAMGNDLAPVPADLHRVGPARHGVLLINPRSGDGKAERCGLERHATTCGVRSVVLAPGEDVQELAERALADGADVIGMAGGDGSQALVADVARTHDVAFVCVPAGTRNHFALDLGLDRLDVAGALDAFGDAIERRVDLAQLGDRIFVNNASLGVYATVVQSDAYRDAKLATTARMLPDLLGPDAKRFDLRFDGPDGEAVTSADMVLVSNDVYRLDSMSGFGTRPRIDGGVLGVVTVDVDRARDIPALVSAEATGRIRRFPGYREWTTTEFVVDSTEPLIDVGVDGEALCLRPPLRFRSLPGALRVRVPTTAPGVSPAAAAPPKLGEAVPALLRVARGEPAR
jgi:diacylglycerol kinase family enzyme